MSFSEVKNLRKAGSIDEAFAMAQADLNADPENIWHKRSIAWVYFDQLKAAALAEDFDSFEQTMHAIATVGLPAEEHMFWEQLCWQIGKMAFAVQKVAQVDYSFLDRLFQHVVGLPLPKPTTPYSYLLKAFQKSNKVWSPYQAFIEWWGIENLMPEDYLSDVMPDGKKTMALAEQVAIAYARKLTEAPISREKIEAFLPVLDQLIHDHPEYQYPPYYKGKLLLAIGDNEHVFSAFLPFARKKQTEFWIWDMLAETFPQTDVRYVACLCRALQCRAEPHFLGKVRTKLAVWLLANQYPKEAKTEIDAFISVYQGEGWKLRPEIQSWIKEDWYQQTTALPDNRALYQQFQDLADEILFGDVTEEVIVVDFVNRDKGVLYFVGEKGKHGGLKYGKRLKNIRIGDLVFARFSEESRDGMYRAYTLQLAPEETASKLKRNFEGLVAIRSGQPFGFVDQVFVEPDMVQKNNLLDGQALKGVCILSWNKKREAMTWKAISLLNT